MQATENELRTVKLCPYCSNRDIRKVKIRQSYRCASCKRLFTIPAIAKVADKRNNLPVPPSLRANVKS